MKDLHLLMISKSWNIGRKDPDLRYLSEIFYGLSEKLKVGEVTNMYEIAATMSKASLIVSP